MYEKDYWKQYYKTQGVDGTILVRNSSLDGGGMHLSVLPFPLLSISLVSFGVCALRLGSLGHLIVDLTSCIRKRCFLASEPFALLFAGDSVFVGLCSLCIPTFCAISAFLSMTGCRKGALWASALSILGVGQTEECAHLHAAKMHAREEM